MTDTINDDLTHASTVFADMCKRWTETKYKVTIDQYAQDTIKAALTVLQKIASGDDWFDIESAPFNSPVLTDEGTAILGRYQYMSDPIRWILCDGDGGKVGCADYGAFTLDPTKWKPLDGATHIKMLLEREMK